MFYERAKGCSSSIADVLTPGVFKLAVLLATTSTT